ncbi:MAG: MFS transporter [Planctomycetes bacterium]|nr:MFS transporter [Planctomycetota bacterium]
MAQVTSTPDLARQAAPADVRETHYRRNLFLLTATETGWGFGMAFGFSASFVQLVLRDLGATHGQIGLLAAQWGFGTLPMVLAGYFTGHLRRKKAAVVWGHYVCVLPVAFLAAALYWVPSNSAKVWCVLAAEYAFGLSVGLLVPVWLTFMGKVLPPKKLGAGFGVTFFFQTLAAALAAWAASVILARRPDAVPHLVAVTALVMLVANAFYIPVREPETEGEAPAGAFHAYLRTLLGELRTNPAFRNMLFAEVLFCAQYGVVGFYAARAADFGGDVRTGAQFTLAIAAAQGVSSLLGGFLVDRIGAKPVLAAGRLAVVAAAACAWHARSVHGLLWAALFVGAFWGVRSAAGFAMFRAVARREEVTSLYGIFSVFVAPFAAATPLVAGWMLGRGLSAPTLFAACGAVALASVGVLVFGVRVKRG